MNLDAKDLERVLSELAERVDRQQAPFDRLATIHRRARRDAIAHATAVSVGVAAAAVLGVVVVGAGGLPALRGREAPPAASAHPSPATTPYLSVDLIRDESAAAGIPTQGSGTTVVVQVRLKGLVPQRVDATGKPASLPTDQLSGLVMNWGDGSVDRNVAQYRCVPRAPLVAIDTSFLMTSTFSVPGTYAVTYSTGACDPVAPVTKTIQVVVQ